MQPRLFARVVLSSSCVLCATLNGGGSASTILYVRIETLEEGGWVLPLQLGDDI